MNWHRHTDYHNSRSYGDRPPKAVAPGPMLAIAWLIDVTRRTLDRLMTPDRRPSETMVLRRGDSHGFTLLGGTIAQHAAPESPCAFPELGGAAARQRSTQHMSGRSPEHAREPANDLSSQFGER